jgi:hypothetical protein
MSRKIKRPEMKISGLFCKFFLAFGTGNGNFTLAARHTNGLSAAGAGKISVLPVANALYKEQIFPIFPVTLIGVAGKATV